MSRFRPLDSVFLHPFLWALYPPLALLARNMDQIPPGMALRSMLVSLLLAGGVLLVVRLILHDWSRAAIFASAFMIAFFSYGHVYQLVEDRQVLGFLLGRHRFLGPTYLVLLGALLVGLWRRADLRQATQAFNLIGLVMLLLPGYQIISDHLESYLAARKLRNELLPQEVVDLRVTEGNILPDIYYIILDTYTRQDILKEQFGYENQPFLRSLQERGFYTAGCSRSNYSNTSLSLTSTLNLDYLHNLDDKFSPPNTRERDLYPYLWNNRVVRALQELGYRFLAFASGYSPTEFHAADVYYSQETDLLGILFTDGINPYESLFLTTSAGMFIYEVSPHLPAPVQKFLALETAYIVHRNRILYTLSRLERLGGLPGPKFVFVHILSPHNPFVFGPNGEHLERETPFTLNDDREVILLEEYVQGYRDQVNYLNQRMLAVIDSILAQSAQPPVILIQGDHGVPRLEGYQNAILSAYLLPGKEGALYASISPVNSFRVVFNEYFGGGLELLADEACIYAEDSVFACAPVEDPNPACAVP
jgi:uncharacterized SAM-binding protein YcdF (DUF218 family)